MFISDYLERKKQKAIDVQFNKETKTFCIVSKRYSPTTGKLLDPVIVKFNAKQLAMRISGLEKLISELKSLQADCAEVAKTKLSLDN